MIRTHMSESDYRAASSVSKSDLDSFRRSPAHYLNSRTNPRKPTDAMVFGSLVHSVTLEPEQVDRKFVVRPDNTKGHSKAAVAAYCDFKASCLIDGRRVVELKDVARAGKVSEAVKSHPSAKKLIEDILHVEASVFVQDGYGTNRKSRIDALTKSGLALDLKTTADASTKEFSKSIFNYRYHVQAAFYSDNLSIAGYKLEGFRFIAVETEPPFAVAVYELDTASIDLGRFEYEQQLKLYRECLEYDAWPAYSSDSQTISLPSWAFIRN